MVLLDSPVLFEMLKAKPDGKVEAWLAAQRRVSGAAPIEAAPLSRPAVSTLGF